jgi:hypothetical protein
MLSVLLLAAAVAAGPVPPSDRGVRYYLGGNRLADNVAFAKASAGAANGAYICCNLASIASDGSMSSDANATSLNEESTALRQVFKTQSSSKLAGEVWHVVGVDQIAVENSTWRHTSGLTDLAAAAKSWGSTGLVVDYEPSTNYTMQHAEAYGAFLSALGDALHAQQLLVGMDIAGWGILGLPYWSAYPGLDRYTSMTPTYTGVNVTLDIDFATQAVATLPKGTPAFGIGTELVSSCGTPKWDYHWTEASLRSFVAGAAAAGAAGIDFWRADIDHYCNNGTQPWMLQASRDFLAGNL